MLIQAPVYGIQADLDGPDILPLMADHAEQNSQVLVVLLRSTSKLLVECSCFNNSLLNSGQALFSSWHTLLLSYQLL